MGLSQLGWSVSKALVYERLPCMPEEAQLDRLASAQKLISLWTSVSALTLAQENLPADLWEKILQAPVLVISKRIQNHLHQLGADNVEVSDGPGNPDILRSILKLRG